MRGISAIEVYVLVKELQRLKGFYIDNFYEAGENRFRLRLSKSGEKVDIFCLLPYTLNVTDYIEKGEQKSNFYIAVRKRIAGARIDEVTQVNGDRIVKIAFSKGGEQGGMVFELFAKGNLLVIDGAGKISIAYRSREFKYREIRTGKEYVPPESRGISASEISKEKVLGLLEGKENADDGLVKSIAGMVNIGANYIENAVLSAGLDPRAKVKSVDRKSMERLAEEVLRCAESAGSELTIYMKDGKPFDYSVCSIGKYNGLEKQRAETLSKALDAYYHEGPAEEQDEDDETAKKIEGIRVSIERQKDALAKMDGEVAEARAKGEEIFKNISVINSIVQSLKENKRMTKEELQKLFPEIKIIDVDLKEKTVTIDI